MSPTRPLFAGLLLTLALTAAACAVPAAAPSGTPATSSSAATAHAATQTAQVAQKLVREFDTIAKEHGGNRAVGTAGGTASGDLVREELERMGLEPTVQTFTTRDGTEGRNIIADLTTGTGAETIILGAHYDSVPSGPGIADNASGVAALLAAASSVEARSSDATIRLAFWDAEETGVEGSAAYVASLPADQRAHTSYVNFDMVASKRSDFVLIDGARTSLESAATLLPEDIAALTASLPPVPAGSDRLDEAVRQAFAGAGELDGGFIYAIASDTGPFLDAGMRISGISVISTPDPRATPTPEADGSVVSEFITCYHAPCDDATNIDEGTLAVSTESIARLLDGIVRATP